MARLGAAPEGLEIARDVITPAQEAALIDACSACDLAYYEQDPGNPRSRKSFGWQYDIAADRFLPGEPLPGGFYEVRGIAARFAGVAAEDIVDCLINRYEPGALIQPHFDKPFFKDVIGLSLASDCAMVFSRPGSTGEDDLVVTLPRRAMYRLSGDARFVYQHAIPPVAEMRWSLTLRTLTADGEALRQSMASGASG